MVPDWRLVDDTDMAIAAAYKRPGMPSIRDLLLAGVDVARRLAARAERRVAPVVRFAGDSPLGQVFERKIPDDD